MTDHFTQVFQAEKPTENLKPRYEVQTYTICDGWINTWFEIDENGIERPETFETEEEAEAAIAEFLADIQEQIDAGDRLPEHGYSADEFGVAEVKPTNKGENR